MASTFMRYHHIPPDTFFIGSPEIHVNRTMEHDSYVLKTMREEEGNHEKGTDKNCFLRRASDQERDGHLARLKAVLRMDSFLHKVGDAAKVFYHGQVSAFHIVNHDNY